MVIKKTLLNPKSEYLILDILQYIKIIFSDLFYIFISFVIDLILLLFVKKSISKKEKLTVSFVFMDSFLDMIIKKKFTNQIYLHI